MKKNIFVFFTFAIVTTIVLRTDAQGTWTKESNFPGLGRYYGAGFSIGHYGFIGCGENASTYFNDFYKWDQSTNTWKGIANYPGTGLASPITASIEGSGYVGLGFDVIAQTAQQDLWKYDTLANSWTKMASFPGIERYDASFFTIGYKIYVVGGSDNHPPYFNDVWVYNAHTNSWKQLNNSPALNTDNMAAFSIGAHGYIGGGWNSSSIQSACWQYDTTSDAWTSISALPIPIFGDPRTFVIGSKAYVCNGKISSSEPVPAGYVYDTITKAWSKFTNMGTVGIERGVAAAFSIGNMGYIGTGEDSLGNFLNDFWQFSIDTPVVTCDKWTKESNFPGLGRYYGAGFSIGHYGFIGCGENASTYFNDFYKWDQSTNTWKGIANYPGTGLASPITASIEGSGYVGLGFDVIAQTAQQDLWKYDTLANSWTKMASFPGIGRYDASFFTIGYKIYVVGGSDNHPPYFNDVWVYNAHTNSWKQLNNSPALNTDNMAAFSIGAHGYIGGGWNSSSIQSACWQYDTTSDAWTPISALPIPIFGDPRTFVIGSKAYVCNGKISSSEPVPAGYVYDTITKAWSKFTNMGTVGIERGVAAAFSIGNVGYIGTGEDSLGNFLNDFWQYSLCDTSLSGINEIGLTFGQIKLYPNPSDGNFNFSYSGLKNQKAEFKIFDMLGRVLYSYAVTGSEGKLIIDQNSLSSGLYFYVLISADKILNKGKIIIEK